MSIDVYATAGAVVQDLRSHACVLVDVLRATSVIITAVEHGCKSVIPVAEVEDAALIARQLGSEDVLLCGERKGVRIPGFQLSNSPLEYTQDAVSGRSLVMSTTNGTGAILRVSNCKAVFMGGFLNAKAVAEAALSVSDSIAIVCAGTDARYSLDDILCSGAIISRIMDLTNNRQSICDLGRTALALYDSYNEDLFSSLQGSLHFERLRALGFEDDLRYCLQEDVMQAVPEYKNGVIRLRQSAK